MMLSRWGQRGKFCRLSLPALSLEAFKHCGVTKGAQPLAIHGSGGGKLGWGRSRTPAASPPWDSGTASSGPQPVRACARPGRPRASSAAAKEEPVRAAPSPPRLATSGGSSSWGSSRRRRRPAPCWVLRGAALTRSPRSHQPQLASPSPCSCRSWLVRGPWTDW